MILLCHIGDPSKASGIDYAACNMGGDGKGLFIPLNDGALFQNVFGHAQPLLHQTDLNWICLSGKWVEAPRQKAFPIKRAFFKIRRIFRLWLSG
jgi:hypothetical protein